MHLGNMALEELIRPEGHTCACGRHHGIGLKFLRIGSDVILVEVREMLENETNDE